MLESTPILGLKQKNSNRPKWPNLAEAYKFFTGKEMIGAHNALNDCLATREIYMALKYNSNKDFEKEFRFRFKTKRLRRIPAQRHQS